MKLIKNKIDIPMDIFTEWQDILTYSARRMDVPCALIMRIDLPDIKVFVSSRTKENPYHSGGTECLKDSGLYCEKVFKTRKKLLVENALKDREWSNNPDIKLGMISYLGFPILWPDQEVFGTICVLDKKSNAYNRSHEELLCAVKKYVEIYLDILVTKHLIADKEIDIKKGSGQLKEKERAYKETLGRIDVLLHQVIK